jgi:Flp pilus assembly protein CpaB
MKEKDNDPLFQDLASIIEQGKRQVAVQVNSVITLT